MIILIAKIFLIIGIAGLLVTCIASEMTRYKHRPKVKRARKWSE